MSYSACPVHNVAFSNPRSATAHMRFKHRDGEPTEVVTYESREEIPESYRVEEKTWFEKNPTAKKTSSDDADEGGVPETKGRASPVKRGTAGPSEQEEDPAVETLGRMLDTIGVSERETAAAVKGFRLIPSLRDRAENLDAWLRSQIRDRRLHAHIPLVVTTVFELDVEDQGAPRYYLGGGRGNEAPPFYGGRNDPWRPYGPYPDYGSPRRRGSFDPLSLATDEEPVSGPLSLVKKLQVQIEEMKAAGEKERAERKQEEADRLAREKEEKWEGRIDRVERAVLALGGAEEAKEKVNPLLEEIKSLRAQMEENRLTTLKTDLDSKLSALAEALKNLKEHPEDLSLEGVATRLGPTIIEKARDAGKDLIAELRGIREGSLAAVAKPPVARTTEEVIRLGEVENDILRLAKERRRTPEAPPVETPAEVPAQSAEAAAITNVLKQEQAAPSASTSEPAVLEPAAATGGTP